MISALNAWLLVEEEQGDKDRYSSIRRRRRIRPTSEAVRGRNIVLRGFPPRKSSCKTLFFGPLCCSLCRRTLRNSPNSCNGIHAYAYTGSGEGEKPELGIVSLFVCLHAHNTFLCECVCMPPQLSQFRPPPSDGRAMKGRSPPNSKCAIYSLFFFSFLVRENGVCDGPACLVYLPSLLRPRPTSEFSFHFCPSSHPSYLAQKNAETEKRILSTCLLRLRKRENQKN